MKIHVSDKGGISIVVLGGNISQEYIPMFRLKLQELIEEGRKDIVLDLAEAQYISSMGIAIIVDAKTKVAKLDGDLKIVRLNKLIRNLFEITNLTRKFDIYDSVEDACAAFGKTGA